MRSDVESVSVMSVEPPPLLPPVRNEWRQAPPPPKPGPKIKGPLGAIGAFLAATWKFILPALKLLKGAKFLLTGFTMAASMWVYSIAFGWWFAVGLVVSIFIHEMGHVAMSA